MASNKSQLDVYKLDIPTVVNEMHDSMTEEEKAEFVELQAYRKECKAQAKALLGRG